MAEGDKPRLKIIDGRKVSAATGEPLKLNRGGDYDPEVIKQITLAALAQGNDPYTALAIGMQESGLGTNKNFNGQENYGQVDKNKWRGNPELMQMIKSNPQLNANAVAMNYVLRKKLEENKDADEAVKIQGYNGYRLHANNDIGAKTMYGIDLTKYPQGYDLRADPRYGKSVLDLRENVLKKNKTITDFVESLKPNNQFSGIRVRVENNPNGTKKLSYMKGDALVRQVDVAAADYDNPLTRPLLLRTALEQK